MKKIDSTYNNPEEDLFGSENSANEVDDQSFDDLLRKFVVFYKKAKQLVKDKFLYFLVFFLIGVSVTIYKLLTISTNFKATIVFMLQEDGSESSPYLSMADPLSSFMLSRATSQSIDIDRIKEISLSQKVITNLLFTKCIVRGREDYLINHYLRVYYGYEDSYFKNYRGLNGLNRNHYRVLSQVISHLKINVIKIEQNKSGAYVLTILTKDEELSKVISEIYYQNVSNFYIDKTTEKAQRNYIFLRNRLDSVRNMLYATEYQVANFEDRAHNLLLNTARVPQNRQFRNTEFYQAIYGETLKTFESSKVTLNNITPIFQVLNRPYYPLPSERSSRTIIAIIGMVITGFVLLLLLGLIYVYVYVWPKYRDIINNKSIEESAQTELMEESSNTELNS